MKLTIKNHLYFIAIIFLSIACTSEKIDFADKVFKNGAIYTADNNNSKVEAVAVKGDRILATGTQQEIEKYIGENTQIIDLQGMTMTPGFIEGHGHFMGLGLNEMQLDLLDVKSYDELVERVAKAVSEAEPGQWIIGRGWHQSKWNNENEKFVQGFQTHEKLSAVSPDNPVYLKHASGHAAFANQKAMEIAGVTQLSKEPIGEKDVKGGEIIRDELGNPTGIFNERGMRLIADHIPHNNVDYFTAAMQKAVAACWRNGITSFHDAGVKREFIELYQAAKAEGKLGVRLYVMLTGWDPQLLEDWYKKGPMIDSIDNLLTIRSVKLNCDGALGSRGAWLLEEYTDRPGHYGHETLSMDSVMLQARNGLKYGFQVCAHAIGDRANKEILDRYEIAFNEAPDAGDVRYRIEHAQHLHPDDIARFGQLGVIPAMQAVHMSSDRPWAIDRLGEKRIVEGAYMWQELIKTGAVIVNGTDVPVEPINPLASFYASVSRKTLSGTPEGGYEPAQKMTREQALKSYTINAAYGAFEEKVKGSIEPGKLADFTVFTDDLMTIPEEKILDIEVGLTVIGGKVVYQKNQ